MLGESSEKGATFGLAVLRARKWTIVVVTVVVLASSLFFSYRQTPLYLSTASVLVQSPSQSALQVQANMATEKEVATSVVVATRVIENLKLPAQAKDLLKHLSVEVPVDSGVLVLNYASTRPRDAQRTAAAFANAYLRFRQQEVMDNLAVSEAPLQDQIKSLDDELRSLQTGRDAQTAAAKAQSNQLVTQISILEEKLATLVASAGLSVSAIIQPASLPTSPWRPRHKKDGALGLVMGLMLGGAAALLRDRFDDRIRGRDDMEACLGAPVLGAIPWVRRSRAPGRGLVTMAQPEPFAAETFRRLAANFSVMAARRTAKTILITSARESEGKSFTTANLAVALARAGKRVIAISADLHRPTLERYFGYDDGIGFADLLRNRDTVAGRLLPGPLANLSVLSRGFPIGNPAELFGKSDAAALLGEMEGIADFVLLDTPPLLVVTDAAALVPICDAVLFVAVAGATTRAEIRESLRELDSAGARLLGAVVIDRRMRALPRYPYIKAKDEPAEVSGALAPSQ